MGDSFAAATLNGASARRWRVDYVAGGQSAPAEPAGPGVPRKIGSPLPLHILPNNGLCSSTSESSLRGRTYVTISKLRDSRIRYHNHRIRRIRIPIGVGVVPRSRTSLPLAHRGRVISGILGNGAGKSKWNELKSYSSVIFVLLHPFHRLQLFVRTYPGGRPKGRQAVWALACPR